MRGKATGQGVPVRRQHAFKAPALIVYILHQYWVGRLLQQGGQGRDGMWLTSLQIGDEHIPACTQPAPTTTLTSAPTLSSRRSWHWSPRRCWAAAARRPGKLQVGAGCRQAIHWGAPDRARLVVRGCIQQQRHVSQECMVSGGHTTMVGGSIAALLQALVQLILATSPPNFSLQSCAGPVARRLTCLPRRWSAGPPAWR